MSNLVCVALENQRFAVARAERAIARHGGGEVAQWWVRGSWSAREIDIRFAGDYTPRECGGLNRPSGLYLHIGPSDTA